MPHLGEIAVDIRLVGTNSRTACEVQGLVSALREFLRQPPLESDGKFRVSYNSVHFLPSAVNVGFLDDVPCDIRVQPLNFCRYGICLPPNSVDEFHCYGFPHRIRSDCELTHFFEHVWYVMKPGATCHFRATNLMELMERCIDAKGRDNELHIIERQLFTGHDRSGLYFNQACINRPRLVSRMRHAGFLRIDVEEDEAPDNAALPKEADQIWLREFTPEQMEECLSAMTCVMPGCRGMRWFKLYRPTERSIYCRKHFRKAHRKYLDALNKRLAIRWSSVKPEERIRTSSRCLLPELSGDAPIWRGAKADLGKLSAMVSLTGVGANCTCDSLLKMVGAIREFRHLPPPSQSLRVSYNSDRFIPECVNIGNIQTSGWEWDVAASRLNAPSDRLSLPPNSADEFHCYGYAQRLSEPILTSLFKDAHRILKPYGVLYGSVNDLDAAKRRFLKASGISDPLLAAECLSAPPLTPQAIRMLLESVGFALTELRRGGNQYGSTEDVLLPAADAEKAGTMRFSSEGEGCCACGKPRFWPQDGIRATGVDPTSCPSIYCRRHFTHAARELQQDILARATVIFTAVKRYRVSGGRRIRIRP